MLFMLALLAVGTMMTGGCALKNAKKNGSGPEKAILSFIDDWSSYEGNPLSDGYYKNNPSVSEEYEKKVDSIVTSFDKTGYDPVLCAQDRPDSIEAVNSSIKGDQAVIRLKYIYSGGDKMSEALLNKNNGRWVIRDIICKKGEHEEAKGVSPAVKNLVETYIKDNITEISPESAVLGGKFQVSSIDFTGPSSCVVDYEDGHIALRAKVGFSISGPEEVSIDYFDLIEDEEEIDFSETGNIVGKAGEWELVYEKSGKPALRTGLIFNEASRCVDGRQKRCRPAYWQNGDRAEIKGFKKGDSILVSKLRIVGESSKNISDSDLAPKINSFEECTEAGYEAMYPDCETCLPYCETDNGRRFEKKESVVCVDNCGNGICEEMVCMGEGCPCAETPESCPKDCR